MAYRVQYTCTRVRARIPNGQPRDDPREEVGEDVRVGVGVRVGPVEFQLNEYLLGCWYRAAVLRPSHLHIIRRCFRHEFQQIVSLCTKTDDAV